MAPSEGLPFGSGQGNPLLGGRRFQRQALLKRVQGLQGRLRLCGLEGWRNPQQYDDLGLRPRRKLRRTNFQRALRRNSQNFSDRGNHRTSIAELWFTSQMEGGFGEIVDAAEFIVETTRG